MEIIHRCCCGIDVHAKTVVVCIIKNGKKQIRTYSTKTDDLLTLSDWLVSEGCKQVAIASTGVYWKPMFNTLKAFSKSSWSIRDTHEAPVRDAHHDDE